MAEETDPNNEHVLNPRPSCGHYTLPCGYLDSEGVLHTDALVREATGVEEELLAGRGDVLFRMNKMMANCLQQIGPHEVNGRVNIVSKFTAIDRYFLLIAVRRASLGDKYTVEAKCPQCEKAGKFDADLSRLPVKPMSDPRTRVWTGKVPSGSTFKAHIMTGEDELWLAATKAKLEGTAELTLALMARVDEWDGEPIQRDPLHRTEFNKSIRKMAGLGLRDRSAIRKLTEQAEGDIDLTLDFECNSCGHRWKGDMNIASAGFFFPSET
jgi:hypothetical protein